MFTFTVTATDSPASTSVTTTFTITFVNKHPVAKAGTPIPSVTYHLGV